MVLLSAQVERVSVSRMRDFLEGFPQLNKLYFKTNIKTASFFPRLLPIISQVLLPSSARLPEHFCHLGKGEGNENRECRRLMWRGGEAGEKGRIGEVEEGGGEELSLQVED